jgi:hypothetical protein
LRRTRARQPQPTGCKTFNEFVCSRLVNSRTVLSELLHINTLASGLCTTRLISLGTQEKRRFLGRFELGHSQLLFSCPRHCAILHYSSSTNQHVWTRLCWGSFCEGKALARGELFSLYTLPKGEARDRAAGFSISSRDDACRTGNPREVPSESRLDLHAHRIRHWIKILGAIGSASSVPNSHVCHLPDTAKGRSIGRSCMYASCMRLGINPWQTGLALSPSINESR